MVVEGAGVVVPVPVPVEVLVAPMELHCDTSYVRLWMVAALLAPLLHEQKMSFRLFERDCNSRRGHESRIVCTSACLCYI